MPAPTRISRRPRPRPSPVREAWFVALLLAALDVRAAGFRLLSPMPLPHGGMELVIVGIDSMPLAADLAERLTLVAATSLETPASAWTPLSGPRSLVDGTLRIEYRPAVPLPSPWFAAARESPTPPPPITVRTAAEFRAAVGSAGPGSRILLAPGSYSGGFYFANLRGEPDRPILIAAADSRDRPVIRGGSNGLHLVDPAWLELQDLDFAGATGNGVNIDDGGTFDTPAHHLRLRGLRITDVGPSGNRDGLKLSGVQDFRVDACTIERWGTGGSGVDMVGCHRGVIEGNVFRHSAAAAASGANGVQTKGGTSDVTIRRNRFEHAGARSVNIGGSTGLEFFRPALIPGAEAAEAREIVVEGNTFVGSTAPTAYVGVDGAIVRFNTIYRPERWVIRILQETTAAGFVPCRNGVFTGNLVAFHSSQWASGGINLGPGTAPATFRFAGNWWYCLDDPARSRPSLPVAETAGVYGQSPRFRDADGGDFRLEPDSPAIGVGAEALTD